MWTCGIAIATQHAKTANPSVNCSAAGDIPSGRAAAAGRVLGSLFQDGHHIAGVGHLPDRGRSAGEPAVARVGVVLRRHRPLPVVGHRVVLTPAKLAEARRVGREAAVPVAVLAGAENAHAQAKQTVPEKSLYERLGGVFAIAAVVDHFSDAVVKNPIVGQESKNPQLREWHTNNLGRLPGLKFMRTLWVCNVSGGPFHFTATKPGKTPLGLEEAHRNLRISPAEFDEVAAEQEEPFTRPILESVQISGDYLKKLAI
mgnify:CR=1 FL=1